MNSLFSAHGQCHYTIENNIIIIDAEGPWNYEFFKQMHEDLRRLVTGWDEHKNYGLLVTLRGESLAVQEGLAYHLKQVRQGTLKAIAINLGYSSYQSSTQSMFQKVYDEAKLKNQFFTSTTDAKEWLTHYLSNNQ